MQALRVDQSRQRFLSGLGTLGTAYRRAFKAEKSEIKMKIFCNTPGAVAVILSALVAKVIGLDDPIEGYAAFTPEWEVEVSPSGRMMRLNGTIEEIYRELLLINPKYEEEFVIAPEPKKEPPPSAKLSANSSSLQGTDWNLGTSICGGRWQAASVRRIKEGIEHLRRVRGRPGSEPGPSRCGRVSCSYNSAIWWCNDDGRPKKLSSFSDIANGAQLLVTRCVEWMNPEPRDIGGQAFHPSKWNVIVRRDRC
ncbi:hypothetical protein HRG_004783 [Hirsutella rhossiliensis]